MKASSKITELTFPSVGVWKKFTIIIPIQWDVTHILNRLYTSYLFTVGPLTSIMSWLSKVDRATTIIHLSCVKWDYALVNTLGRYSSLTFRESDWLYNYICEPVWPLTEDAHSLLRLTRFCTWTIELSHGHHSSVVTCLHTSLLI